MQSSVSTVAFGIAENGLTFVVFGTVAFSFVMSVLFLVTRGTDSMYDQIGQGGLSRESDFVGAAPAPPKESAAAALEREREVRQMLHARSERLVRRGEPALDIDAEVSRLLAPASAGPEHDAGLQEEVRQMVIARNERRARQGLEPLEVEAEVQRTLRELEA
ncbi:MAG TPA: hypothetical protein VKG82_11595 [Solirubrobacteraceae bacterium]|nr:hypothetical protein [Solirubrobacteraceae bacterium]